MVGKIGDLMEKHQKVHDVQKKNFMCNYLGVLVILIKFSYVIILIDEPDVEFYWLWTNW